MCIKFNFAKFDIDFQLINQSKIGCERDDALVRWKSVMCRVLNNWQ